MFWEAIKHEAMYGTLGLEPLQAGIYASKTLIDRLGYNSYNVANDMLIDPVTGRLNPSAQLLYHDDWQKDPFKMAYAKSTIYHLAEVMRKQHSLLH